MAATTTHPLIPFDTASAASTPNDIADDHSLLKIDQELDFLMEQIEDEIEESGEASKEAMDRLAFDPNAVLNRGGIGTEPRTILPPTSPFVDCRKCEGQLVGELRWPNASAATRSILSRSGIVSKQARRDPAFAVTAVNQTGRTNLCNTLVHIPESSGVGPESLETYRCDKTTLRRV